MLNTKSRRAGHAGRGAAALLALAALACSQITVSVGGQPTATTAPTAPPPTLTPAPQPTEALPPPTDTPAPTTEPSATAPPTATAGPFEVILGRSYLSDIGNYTVVGEVVNHTEAWAWFVELTVTFYDEAGDELGSETGFTSPSQIGPGEAQVFSVFSGLEGAAASVASVSVEVTDLQERDEPPYRMFEVTVGSEGDEGAGLYAIRGTVRNTGDMDCEFTRVIAGFYDAEGKVIEVASSFTDQDVLRAGATGAFDINTFYVDESLLDHRELWVQCGFGA